MHTVSTNFSFRKNLNPENLIIKKFIGRQSRRKLDNSFLDSTFFNKVAKEPRVCRKEHNNLVRVFQKIDRSSHTPFNGSTHLFNTVVTEEMGDEMASTSLRQEQFPKINRQDLPQFRHPVESPSLLVFSGSYLPDLVYAFSPLFVIFYSVQYSLQVVQLLTKWLRSSRN